MIIVLETYVDGTKLLEDMVKINNDCYTSTWGIEYPDDHIDWYGKLEAAQNDIKAKNIS